MYKKMLPVALLANFFYVPRPPYRFLVLRFRASIKSVPSRYRVEVTRERLTLYHVRSGRYLGCTRVPRRGESRWLSDTVTNVGVRFATRFAFYDTVEPT